MRSSDWSSDVCSTDLFAGVAGRAVDAHVGFAVVDDDAEPVARIERAAERHRRLLWDRGHGIDTAGEVGRRYRDGADRAYDSAAPIGARADERRGREGSLSKCIFRVSPDYSKKKKKK